MTCCCGRVEELPENARYVVAWAAVCGPTITHRLLAATSELVEPDLLEALRVATKMRVLLPDQTGYAFRHSLLRGAVHDAQRVSAFAEQAQLLRLVAAGRSNKQIADQLFVSSGSIIGGVIAKRA